MKIQRIDHVGINFEDLPAAIAFFLDLGFELLGEAQMEGPWLDGIVRLQGVKTSFVMVGTPDGQTKLELIKYIRPDDAAGLQQTFANTLGIRHIAIEVEDLDAIVDRLKKKGVETFSEVQTYENSYKLVYIRGPEGIILELAEEIK